MQVSCGFARCKGTLKVNEKGVKKVVNMPHKLMKGKDMGDLQQMPLTEEQRSIAAGFIAIAKDLQSYKAAIARLAENETAQHAQLQELAEMVNAHTAILEALRVAVEAKLGTPGSIH
jgi:hypothetical protein